MQNKPSMMVMKLFIAVGGNVTRQIMQTIYCIIFKPEETWRLFTNQVFMTEDEALDFGKRSNIKYKRKKIDWKVADAAEWF